MKATTNSKINLKDLYPSKEVVKKNKLTEKEKRTYALITFGYGMATGEIVDGIRQNKIDLNYDYIQSGLIMNLRQSKKDLNGLEEKKKESIQKSIHFAYSLIHKAKLYLGMKSKEPIYDSTILEIEKQIKEFESNLKETKNDIKEFEGKNYKEISRCYGYKLTTLITETFEREIEDDVERILQRMNMIEILIEVAQNYKKELDNHLSFVDLQESLEYWPKEIEAKRKEIIDKRKNNLILKA